MYEDENKRDIHARSSSAARHATTRRGAARCGLPMSKFLPRTTGIRKVTWELKPYMRNKKKQREYEFVASYKGTKGVFHICNLLYCLL